MKYFCQRLTCCLVAKVAVSHSLISEVTFSSSSSSSSSAWLCCRSCLNTAVNITSDLQVGGGGVRQLLLSLCLSPALQSQDSKERHGKQISYHIFLSRMKSVILLLGLLVLTGSLVSAGWWGKFLLLTN